MFINVQYDLSFRKFEERKIRYCQFIPFFIDSKEGMMVERSQVMTAWTANSIVALVIGVVFTLIGVIGFFIAPGMAPGNLLGFDIDLVHNLIHLITGLLALIAVFTGWSRLFNRIFGVIYILIGVAGLIYPGLYFQGLFLGMMHVNAADHVLHLLTGIIAAGVGFFVADDDTRSLPGTPRPLA
jgi:Domain of unknown function (DUF4383)